MVIANSDSNTTLVSLNNNNNKHYDDTTTKLDETTGLIQYVQTTSGRIPAPSSTGGTPTELLISVKKDDDRMIEETTSQQQSSSSYTYVPLYLPSLQSKSDDVDVDEYISRNYYTNVDLLLPGSNVLKESRNRLLCNSNTSSSPKIRCFGDSATNTTSSNINNQGQPQPRLLYVAQGERANATTNQYDIIMSDKATTCHIVAFRSSCCSTSTSNSTNSNSSNDSDLPLTSLTHLDGPHYDQCIRDMVDEHIHHHQQQQHQQQQSNQPIDDDEKEKRCDDYDYDYINNNSTSNVITIEIHIMGGFNDDDSSSSTITDWLLRLLAQIANEYKFEQHAHHRVQVQPKVQMVIKTLAVSSSNNQQVQLSNNNNSNNTIIDSPIGRGLGIDLRSGEVFLAKCNNTHTSGGPVPVLRSVRLWCREQQHHHQLSVVHTVQDANNLWNSILDINNQKIRNEYNLFWVQPIEFNSCSITNFDSLLQLDDDILLQYTSTSPNVEEDGFCYDVRSSLQFLKKSQHQLKFKQEQEQQQQFFGTNLNRPMVFARRICTTTAGSHQQQQQWKQLPL